MNLKQAQEIVKKHEQQKERQKEIERRDYCKSLVGKYFIYRDNNYGCASDERWNVYIKILGLADSGVYGISYEDIGKQKAQIEIKHFPVYYTSSFNYEEISEDEYKKGVESFMKKWGKVLTL